EVGEGREGGRAVEEQAGKEEDEKGWADAVRAGTPSAFTSYIQKFSSGAHVAEARQRATALETQGRKEVPSIDIKNTCKVAAGAMLSPMGGATTQKDIKTGLPPPQKARGQNLKDPATCTSA